MACAMWSVESVRATAFPAVAPDTVSINWWRDVVGEDPAKATRESRKGSLEQRGSWGDADLVLQVNPLRIDWLLVAPQGSEPSVLPVIGSFVDLLSPFREVVLRWLGLESCPGIVRLAFAASLLQPVASEEQGCRLLAPYLPHVELRPAESRSFQYQISRPRSAASGMPGLEINRLNRWSVLQYVQQTVSFSAERLQTSVADESFACRLDLDINTSRQYAEELPRDRVQDVFRELVQLACEIAEKGDIT